MKSKSLNDTQEDYVANSGNPLLLYMQPYGIQLHRQNINLENFQAP